MEKTIFLALLQRSLSHRQDFALTSPLWNSSHDFSPTTSSFAPQRRTNFGVSETDGKKIYYSKNINLKIFIANGGATYKEMRRKTSLTSLAFVASGDPLLALHLLAHVHLVLANVPHLGPTGMVAYVTLESQNCKRTNKN